jgi:hypothetical protein
MKDKPVNFFDSAGTGWLLPEKGVICYQLLVNRKKGI